MRTRNLRLAFVIAVAFVGASNTASADFINGNFQTGDFTGWTRTAIDVGNNPISPDPFVSVGTSGANHFVDLTPGLYADGLFVATLEQSVLIEAANPFLSFDFSLPTSASDPTGSGASPFLDSVTVSLDDGMSTFALLLLDKNGALADPFGTAPGTVSLGTPTMSGFDFSFSVDASSLIGQTVTAFVEVSNIDDGFAIGAKMDNFLLSPAGPGGQPMVPEPSSLALLSIGGATLLGGFARMRTRRTSERRIRRPRKRCQEPFPQLH